MEKYLRQLEAFLRTLSLRQKAMAAATVALAFLVFGLFLRLTEKAEYKPLFSGMAPADTQDVAQRLAAKNIPYEISTDGTSISIPSDQLDKTRLDFAAEGMPQSGRLGFEIFDKPNWAGSDFSEQVNYQRALEGELERTIQTLGNVESVRVHLVLPHESLFTDRERVAKAAVVLKVRGGGLTADQVNAVTHLVAGAVDNLSPENVTLIGADGRSPLVAQGRDSTSGESPPVEMETALAEKLVATLAPIVGPDHVKASVTVAYDPSTGDSTQDTYDPASAVVVSSQVQEERFGGAPPLGIPGTPSNVPAAGAKPGATPAAPGTPGAEAKPGAAGAAPNATAPSAAAGQTPNAAGTAGTAASNAAAAKSGPAVPLSNPLNPMVTMNAESEDQRSESLQYAVSHTLRHTVDPAGRLQRVAAAVLVDDVIVETKDAKGQVQTTRRKRTPEELKQLEDLAKAAIGFDATRGDEFSLENVTFETPAPETVPRPPVAERVRVLAEKWIWAIRYGVLLILFLLIYMLILRPVKNLLLRSFENAGALPGAAGAPALAGAGAGGGSAGVAGTASGRPISEMSGLEIEAELERDLASTNSDVMRIVKLKKHLAEKVKADPAAATQLVRHWLREGQMR